MTKKERYNIYRKIALKCYNTEYRFRKLFLCVELNLQEDVETSKELLNTFKEFSLFKPYECKVGVWFYDSEFGEDFNNVRGFVMDLCKEMCKP